MIFEANPRFARKILGLGLVFLLGGHTFEVDTFSPHREIVTHNIYIYTHINVYIYIYVHVFIYTKKHRRPFLYLEHLREQCGTRKV